MNARLIIRAPGVHASIQDRGRFGLRRVGVPWSGALDPQLLAIANALVGNPCSHAAIECFDGGQLFEALDAPLRLAVAGDARLQRISPERDSTPAASGMPSLAEHDDDPTPLAWRSLTLLPGQRLRIVTIAPRRIAIVAVAGLVVPHILGSASTYARAGIGGCHGRALAAGDALPVEPEIAPSPRQRMLPTPPEPPDVAGTGDTPPQTVRVVPGPQQSHFEDDVFDAFLAATYRVDAAADRMGMRLQGPPLCHRAGYGHEIVSDAIVPGAIQVPGNGLPIILLADAQTAGGYPKIATVITADLGHVAALRPGDALRFEAVDAETGARIARAQVAEVERLLSTIRDDNPRSTRARVDLDALYRDNLVSGVVNALDTDPAV